ncbi:MAG: hypothetical protein WC755_03180 [Candidatus Woesearchaeota archaeon]|jgi:hypothetical protein
MVTGEELVSKTKKTFDNPLVEMKSLYEECKREQTTLMEREKKVMFHANRIKVTVEDFEKAAKNLTAPINLRNFKEKYQIIKETKGKMTELISDIRNNIVTNITNKIEKVGKLIDENEDKVPTNIEDFKKEVEMVFQEVESAKIFIETATTFMTDEIDFKIAPYKPKIREMGLDKLEY